MAKCGTTDLYRKLLEQYPKTIDPSNGPRGIGELYFWNGYMEIEEDKDD